VVFKSNVSAVVSACVKLQFNCKTILMNLENLLYQTIKEGKKYKKQG